MDCKPLRNLLFVLIAIPGLAAFSPAYADHYLGRTTVGTIPSNGLTADFKRGSKFTLSEPGIVDALSVYLDGLGGPQSGTQLVSLAIYKDNNGVPGIKLGESATTPILAGAGVGWRDFIIRDDVPLPAGDYWLVILSGGTSGIVRDYADGAANWYGNADTFSDEGASPFGSGSAGTGTLSIYAKYATPSERTYSGRSTVGATPSGGLSADFKRASKVTVTQPALLATLNAYLDTLGGGTGSQAFRLALYRDANGVPGTKVIESDELVLPAGRGGRWIDIFIPQTPTLAPGDYWVAIHTGGTAGIIRDFGGDGPANWYGNADTYAGGAGSSFGTGSTGTGTMSVGLTYFPGTFQRHVLGSTWSGGTPSNGLTADYGRAQFYSGTDLPASSLIDGFWAYLDGQGGASGSQQVRISLYRDNCDGQPATLQAESEVVSVVANQAASWIHFPLKTPAYMVQACRYSLALQSGGTQGVARDYAAGTLQWLGVTDAFADGPAPQYPVQSGPGVGVGTGQLGMYVELDEWVQQ